MEMVRLLKRSWRPVLAGLLVMSCGQRQPYGVGKPHSLELGKEYPSPDEAAHTQGISDLFTDMVERKYPADVRPFRRDAHTKAHGCVKAAFTVSPQVPERAKIGVFKNPATYPTWIRFSNAFTSVQADTEADVRGMAIKLMGVAGEKLLESEKLERTQDFLLINTSVFFSPDTSAYLAFTTSYVKHESALGYLLWPTRWRQAAILYRASRANMTNPLTSRFWSTVPFKLGPAAVKYSAKPCAGIVQTGKPGSSPNFLREAMTAYLRKSGACFDFMVQFQTDPVKMPVEDPSVEWDEKVSPFITVATLDIPQQAFDSAPQMEYCEGLSFTPWHSLPQHQPIGGVNRIRKTVYERISTLRHAANGVPRREPSGFDAFTNTQPPARYD
jgi:hypothetical protein